MNVKKLLEKIGKQFLEPSKPIWSDMDKLITKKRLGLEKGKRGFSCKVTFLGESQTGKTSIINRFISNSFSSVLTSSPCASFTNKTILLKEKNESIKLEIWDTAGQTKYRPLVKVFFKDSSVNLLVYDITNKKSFEELKNYWYKDIKENSKNDASK